MRRLLLKLISLETICVVIVSLYNAAYVKMALFERNPNFSVNKFKDVPETIEICDFGNSLAVDAFGDYEGVDKNCFNFALSAQSLSYDYRIMQQYEDRIGEDTLVFVTLNYSCFAVDEENEGNFEAKNERYYYFLDPKYIKNCSIFEFCLIRTFPVLWQTPVAIIQKWQTYKAEKGPEVVSDQIDFSEEANNLYISRKVLDDNGKLIVNDIELDALLGLIRVCKKQSARPILILTPYRKEYTELYDESFYFQYYSLIYSICDAEGCELFDLSHDEEFELTDEYFSDAYHLSEEGSDRFLMRVRDYLDID